MDILSCSILCVNAITDIINSKGIRTEDGKKAICRWIILGHY